MIEYLAMKPLATICTLDILDFFPEYKGAGWYKVDDRWIYVIEDRDQYCVMEWNFDPRPFLAKMIGAEVR